MTADTAEKEIWYASTLMRERFAANHAQNAAKQFQMMKSTVIAALISVRNVSMMVEDS